MTVERLKSIFITVYLAALFVAAVHSLYMLVTSGFEWSWLGAAIALVPAAGLFTWLMFADVARTSANLTAMLIAAYAGSVIALLAWIGASAEALNPGLAFVYAAGLGAAGFSVYVFWYSRFGRAENMILGVGKPLPDFVLEDIEGSLVTSKSFRGKPALFLFYRGNWCPLCMAQIKEVAARYRELSESGVEVVLISPQSHDNTRTLADKFQVPFHFLVDVESRAAKELDILSVNGTPWGMGALGYDADTVLPTVIMTNAAGEIIFADLTDNYRLRPEPDVFIDIMRQHSRMAV